MTQQKKNKIQKFWKESHTRSFMKSLSWVVWATITTMVISYFVTGSFTFSLAIGGLEAISKIFLFYFHERLWDSTFKFGFKLNQPTVE